MTIYQLEICSNPLPLSGRILFVYQGPPSLPSSWQVVFVTLAIIYDIVQRTYSDLGLPTSEDKRVPSINMYCWSWRKYPHTVHFCARQTENPLMDSIFRRIFPDCSDLKEIIFPPLFHLDYMSQGFLSLHLS